MLELRTLLITLCDNEGCFKCCNFFVNHQSKGCVSDSLSGLNYKECTQMDADAAKKLCQQKGKKENKTVASVLTSSSHAGSWCSSYSSFCYSRSGDRPLSVDHEHSASLYCRSVSPTHHEHSQMCEGHSHGCFVLHEHFCSGSWSHEFSPEHPVAAMLGMSHNPVNYMASNKENIIEGDGSDSNMSAAGPCIVVIVIQDPRSPRSRWWRLRPF